MFLIDSSAWIEYFRPNGSTKVKEKIRDAIQKEGVVCCGIIVVEILRGARNDNDYQLLKDALLSLPQIPLDETVIKNAAEWGFILDRKGETVSTTDLFIAAASYKKATILHLDSDFQRLALYVDIAQEKISLE
jgi:predicted nucleic acid-binding protein